MLFITVLVIIIGLIFSVIALSIMISSLVNYIKDKKLMKQVIEEMLKQYKKF